MFERIVNPIFRFHLNINITCKMLNEKEKEDLIVNVSKSMGKYATTLSFCCAQMRETGVAASQIRRHYVYTTLPIQLIISTKIIPQDCHKILS